MADTRTLFARRQWRRRLAAWRPALVAAGLVAVLAFAAWAVFFSTWLAADDVEVSGADTVGRARVLGAADVELGVPLARLDLGEIQRRVAAMPAVAQVEVHRSWPHTVSIEVTERVPIAAARHGGEWWVMDAEGVLFRPSDAREPGLAVVKAPSADPDALREVAEVVAALPASLAAEVDEVRARTMDSIELRLDGRRVVEWGSAAETARKAQVLAFMLDHIPARVYDVSVPDQPTTSGGR